ncbi:substrate-binding domain-containing protein [Pseudomonas lundensis]|uniref:LacI family DNA-binding transcriptional regulator n=1 Tax=Pseudomonas lundensis TaxID=86185 RepID=UPI0006420DD0|nr:substrate-binding domain-containing protein [Pseudomonas lundensis]MBM1186677.1 substrate-binding domain-containing protein [Pseudomonas lundensis]NLT99450.1 substrate-binding domain-containing protein [Pseudomonas lundensis]NNA02034.1 substrate-binding domain-containing protein [Pseudomonas lundensis]NNA06599.1 substrate-binding domain-containing protein [Pseudomonas lundensis]NNA29773.1 substrate-binding domain-containing protein [Pseudomonas lundensis]
MPKDDAHLITAHDVARHAGVSRSAVSRTFTPGASVAPHTRDKVLAAAQALGYQVNLIARTMNKGYSNFVGVVTAGFESPFRASLLSPITDALNKQGLMPLLMNADNPQQLEQSLHTLLSYQIAGVILTSASPPLSVVQHYLKHHIPVAMINRGHELEGADIIGSDNRGGGRLAAQTLLASGARRPAFIGQGLHNFSSRERWLGFSEGLAAAGITPLAVQDAAPGYEGGLAAVRHLFSDAVRPDALFCATDMLALGAMDGVRIEHHLAVPHDVQIIGFDDIPQAAHLAYRLTSLRQDSHELANSAVAAIVARRKNFLLPTPHRSIPVTLVRRNSTLE